MTLRSDALDTLEATSRTFYIPISRLPRNLLEAVGSAYLCMRAIDEIEDHPTLENPDKVKLLRGVAVNLQPLSDETGKASFEHVFQGYEGALPEVTLRISDWAQLAPKSIAPRILDSITAMAERMAYWASTGWNVRNRNDLDRYTFGVAGAVGLMLSDIWAWYDGTITNRVYAIGFGRGLQAVNILRNREDDLSRGVNFFPDGWCEKQMDAYARANLALADAYLDELPDSPAYDFCKIPYDLAYATLDAMERGRRKLSRKEVLSITALPGEAQS